MLKYMPVMIYFLLLVSTKVELIAKKDDDNNINVNLRATRECLSGFKMNQKPITGYLDLFHNCFKMDSFVRLEPRLIEFLLQLFQKRINKAIEQRKATRKYWYLRGGRDRM